MEEYRLVSETKYLEAQYIFESLQAIEMTKSDEEYDVELCCSSPPPSGDIVDLGTVQEDSSIFSWKFVKCRQRPNRRHTVSHAPPAPPSTPTSLTANCTPTASPTASTNLNLVDDERLNSLLYILDYAPKYKKKLKEQERTDNELAELFNVVTITGSAVGGGGGSGGGKGNNNNTNDSSKLPPERGVSAASRVIRKLDSTTKIFKIHRNPKEFFREPDDDSVSAPEYNTEEHELNTRRPKRWKRRRVLRLPSRCMHQERMNKILDNFDSVMRFND